MCVCPCLPWFLPALGQPPGLLPLPASSSSTRSSTCTAWRTWSSSSPWSTCRSQTLCSSKCPAPCEHPSPHPNAPRLPGHQMGAGEQRGTVKQALWGYRAQRGWASRAGQGPARHGPRLALINKVLLAHATPIRCQIICACFQAPTELSWCDQGWPATLKMCTFRPFAEIALPWWRGV